MWSKKSFMFAAGAYAPVLSFGGTAMNAGSATAAPVPPKQWCHLDGKGNGSDTCKCAYASYHWGTEKVWGNINKDSVCGFHTFGGGGFISFQPPPPQPNCDGGEHGDGKHLDHCDHHDNGDQHKDGGDNQKGNNG